MVNDDQTLSLSWRSSLAQLASLWAHIGYEQQTWLSAIYQLQPLVTAWSPPVEAMVTPLMKLAGSLMHSEWRTTIPWWLAEFFLCWPRAGWLYSLPFSWCCSFPLMNKFDHLIWFYWYHVLPSSPLHSWTSKIGFNLDCYSMVVVLLWSKDVVIKMYFNRVPMDSKSCFFDKSEG